MTGGLASLGFLNGFPDNGFGFRGIIIIFSMILYCSMIYFISNVNNVCLFVQWLIKARIITVNGNTRR